MTEHPPQTTPTPLRLRLVINGRVQGVGFRPTVYRLALERGLSGSVCNTPEGVVIEIQGNHPLVSGFPNALQDGLPPLAQITSLTEQEQPPRKDEQGFSILSSTAGSGHQVLISPDIATCPDCLREMNDPGDRRYRYPFTNCTNCGPRFTITRSIPYDRASTSMACFPMCPSCLAEYQDPLNRRFHAQPNACPECGPNVWLAAPQGKTLSRGTTAVEQAAQALTTGRVLALKGLGGFHLVCDAASEEAVRTLRRRKNRWGKPLAVMLPDLETARRLVFVSPEEEELLCGRERPIVLLQRRPDSPLSASLAPDTDRLGIMLPYTPLHHVLLGAYASCLAPGTASALVMTSGNLSSEPIALGNREALERLQSIADLFLLHDRDILVRCDDSVVRVAPGGTTPGFLRRSRGFTPNPVFLGRQGPCVLGLGPELKATVCLAKEDRAFVSQHVGDLENLTAYSFYQETIEHLLDILGAGPQAVVADLHPDYLSTRFALEQDRWPVLRLQHHFAHVHAVLAENGHYAPALGLALDGTGLGQDRTLWGGEGLLVDPSRLEHSRLGHLSPLLLPGGEAAVRQPWRTAQAALAAIGVSEPSNRTWPWLAEHAQASQVVGQMIEKRINSPATTSCGRLFDAVAALLGICLAIDYEGQAAIRLEHAQDMSEIRAYHCPVLEKDGTLELDTRGLFAQVHADWEQGTAAPRISRRFHLGLVQGLSGLALAMSRRSTIRTVALSGGVLQNMTISRELPRALSALGLTPLVHRELPPGDACISLGQAVYGRLVLERS